MNSGEDNDAYISDAPTSPDPDDTSSKDGEQIRNVETVKQLNEQSADDQSTSRIESDSQNYNTQVTSSLNILQDVSTHPHTPVHRSLSLTSIQLDSIQHQEIAVTTNELSLQCGASAYSNISPLPQSNASPYQLPINASPRAYQYTPSEQSHNYYASTLPQDLPPAFDTVYILPPVYEAIDLPPAYDVVVGISTPNVHHTTSSHSQFHMHDLPRRHSRPFRREIVLSCLVTWFCLFVFGFVAYILAKLAVNSESSRRDNEAKRLGRASLIVSVMGIVVTPVVVVTVSFVLVVQNAQLQSLL